MERLESLKALQSWRQSVAQALGETGSLVLVPTMGALHAGHMALVQKARALGDKVVVSIFVNPLQFRPSEDFAQYPRPLEADLALCEAAGVDAVFLPTSAEMYPYGREGVTQVVPPRALIQQLCGQSRPGHFEGVATVVLKFFQLVQPTHAVFGEKDAQQLAVIRQMVRDLNLPITVVPHPTVRSEQGLALSSRNQYLDTPEKQKAALVLWNTLRSVHEAVSREGQLPTRDTLDAAWRDSLRAMGLLDASWVTLDYLEAVDGELFQPVSHLTRTAKVLVAAKIGEVRLIDNLDMSVSLAELPAGTLLQQDAMIV